MNGILKNYSALSKYCYAHSESNLNTSRGNEYGFKIDVNDHSFYIRSILKQHGDYNFYIFCYNNEKLEQYLGNAQEQLDESQNQNMTTMGGM